MFLSVNSEQAKSRAPIIYRWDLDKTYLRTDFDSVRGLLRSAFEAPSRKKTVPGAATLLRQIRTTNPAGIFILSGSPEQMRKALEAKLRLDGIDWDGFTLKPSLHNLVRGRFRFLRDQISYKLGALLRSRTTVDPSTQEVMFGDDAEADAFIYSLYGDIAAGRVSQDALMAVLESAGVYPHDIPQIVRMAARVPRTEVVRRIFIHLDRVSSVERFADFGNRVCPFYNYFQPALVLTHDGLIDASALFRVGADLVVEHGFNPDVLVASFHDLVRRGYLSQRVAEYIVNLEADIAHQVYGSATNALQSFVNEVGVRVKTLPVKAPLDLFDIDYVALYPHDRERAEAAKRRVRWKPNWRS